MLCVSFGSDSAARLPSTPGADSRISLLLYLSCVVCTILCILWTTTPRSTGFGFSVVVVVYVSASPLSLFFSLNFKNDNLFLK
jgi:hypothetical protein